MLKKSFSVDERNFLGPLMRFARADVRDHIVSRKNEEGPSHWSYGPLQRRKGMKIDFRSIFGVVRFSTFATLSVINGPQVASEPCPFIPPDTVVKVENRTGPKIPRKLIF